MIFETKFFKSHTQLNVCEKEELPCLLYLIQIFDLNLFILGMASGKVFVFATQNGKAIESWQAHCSSGVKSVKINAKQNLGK